MQPYNGESYGFATSRKPTLGLLKSGESLSRLLCLKSAGLPVYQDPPRTQRLPSLPLDGPIGLS